MVSVNFVVGKVSRDVGSRVGRAKFSSVGERGRTKTNMVDQARDTETTDCSINLAAVADADADKMQPVAMRLYRERSGNKRRTVGHCLVMAGEVDDNTVITTLTPYH